MEQLSILLFIVILILIISLRNNISKRFDGLEAEIRRLRDQPVKPATEMPVVTPVVRESILNIQTEPILPPEAPQAIESSLSQELSTLLQEAGQTQVFPASPAETPQEETRTEPVAAAGFIPPPPQQPVREHKPSFMERNPDLEKFIGENLVSKIGIVILVLAIGYFVKFAIDNDWIGPVGRVGIGILCGAILITVAHRLRNSYKAFSSVLAGGGLAVFYFTITLGFHQFQLFSQTVAFIIMVVITGFAVMLSHLYNRQEMAIIALIGGFATPFMVSTGSGNYKVLFTYLLILNAGLLIIAYNKAWRLLNLLAFIFTAILFASWLFTLDGNTVVSTYSNGLLFATAFYLLFFAINIAHNIREQKKFIASDFGILLANTSLYFAAGLYLLTTMKAVEYRGLFTAGLSIFNLASTYILFRNRKIDSNILYLLIGITLSFISLTAPIQLNGNNITLFWASEAVLLYWLYQKSKIPIIRLGSLLVWSAMLISLLMDWVNVYGMDTRNIPVVFNRGFITTVFAALSSYFLYMLRKRNASTPTANKAISLPDNIFRIAGIVLLFAAGAFEINHQFQFHYAGMDLNVLYLLLYTFAFIFLLVLITERIPSLHINFYLKAALLALCIFLYLISIPQVFAIQKNMLIKNQFLFHFTAHWLSAILTAMIIFFLIRLIRLHHAGIKKNLGLLSWAVSIIAVIFLSAEIHLLFNNLFYVKEDSLIDIQRVYIKTGLPILWGLCSFGLIWLGMRYKYKPLRIISLTLFSITLLKLFIFDIRNIPIAGKIAAFFSLGILLLVISFMYQRLKKIIIEDEKKPLA